MAAHKMGRLPVSRQGRDTADGRGSRPALTAMGRDGGSSDT